MEPVSIVIHRISSARQACTNGTSSSPISRPTRKHPALFRGAYIKKFCRARKQTFQVISDFFSGDGYAVESRISIAIGHQGIGVCKYQNGVTIMSGWQFEKWEELGSKEIDYDGAIE